MTDNPHWARDDAGLPDPRHVRAARLISVIPDGKLRRTCSAATGSPTTGATRSSAPSAARPSASSCGRGTAPRAICWSCGAAERHRALWLYLQSAKPLDNAKDVLHFSAEYPLAVRLREQIGPGYRTSELEPGKADLAIDITAIDLPDESLDAIICSHVLEHVPDDALAMRELHRVLRPGGTAIVMVPLDHSRATTYEDPSITDPDEREDEFWQHDHVRLYAPDIADRLARGGLRRDEHQPGRDRRSRADPSATRCVRRTSSSPASRVAGSSSSSGS